MLHWRCDISFGYNFILINLVKWGSVGCLFYSLNVELLCVLLLIAPATFSKLQTPA